MAEKDNYAYFQEKKTGLIVHQAPPHRRWLARILDAGFIVGGSVGAAFLGGNGEPTANDGNPLAYLIPALAPDEQDPDELPHHEMAQELTNRGWIDLRNMTAQCEVSGVQVSLVGVDDPHIELDSYPGCEAGTLTIGLTHAPYQRVLNDMAADGVDLVFAGHTHGGQVCIPGYGALITNCDLPTDQVAGLFQWNQSEMKVCISKGLGTSPYAPFRLACRPEVQLVTLT